MSAEEIARACRDVANCLVDERDARGHWRGELSSSALSTATATFALHVASRARSDGAGAANDDGGARRLVAGGVAWLCKHANDDGGWGDTVRSASNLSTTCLAWATLRSCGENDAARKAIERAEAWIARRAGSLEPGALADAIRDVYGADRTFSAPILTMCALAGCLGEEPAAWRAVPQLPFELAALPRGLFGRLGLQVVSYALPALIAIGLVRHRRAPGANAVAQTARRITTGRVLRLLEEIHPSSGGFLEATPLTSFVTMSLCGAGRARHPVVDRSLEFLIRSARADGSWPIDTDLATWVTTLSVNALAAADGLDLLGDDGRAAIRDWIIEQQYRVRHPYTGSAPGGWAWTDLPGGVPDADDTSGALLALGHLDRGDRPDARVPVAVCAGLKWLLDIQNRDGGIPTFCRGWQRLPFDRSSPDLTAHALRAFLRWRGRAPAALARRIRRAVAHAVKYLAGAQRGDGSWVPLWFGNQHHDEHENPTYGTARVLSALRLLAPGDSPRVDVRALERRGVAWLVQARDAGGGWSGSPGGPASVEETALAVDTLAHRPLLEREPAARPAVDAGVAWLIEKLDTGALDQPSPIGFYFAKLWYFERLYPTIFTASALGRALTIVR